MKCLHNTNSGNAKGERSWTTLLRKGTGKLPKSPLMFHKTPPFPTFYHLVPQPSTHSKGSMLPCPIWPVSLHINLKPVHFTSLSTPGSNQVYLVPRVPPLAQEERPWEHGCKPTIHPMNGGRLFTAYRNIAELHGPTNQLLL